MAKFTYRMQNILNIKYKLETQAKTAFSIAAAKLDLEEEKLEGLRHRKMLMRLGHRSWWQIGLIFRKLR